MQFRNRHFFIQQSFITHTTPLKVISSWLVLSDCVFWTTSTVVLYAFRYLILDLFLRCFHLFLFF